MLKIYITTVLIYFIATHIVGEIIETELQKQGLIMPRNSTIDSIKNWSQTIIASVIPVINILFIIFMFVKIDILYSEMKKKCITGVNNKRAIGLMKKTLTLLLICFIYGVLLQKL